MTVIISKKARVTIPFDDFETLLAQCYRLHESHRLQHFKDEDFASSREELRFKEIFNRNINHWHSFKRKK